MEEEDERDDCEEVVPNYQDVCPQCGLAPFVYHPYKNRGTGISSDRGAYYVCSVCGFRESVRWVFSKVDVRGKNMDFKSLTSGIAQSSVNETSDLDQRENRFIEQTDFDVASYYMEVSYDAKQKDFTVVCRDIKNMLDTGRFVITDKNTNGVIVGDLNGKPVMVTGYAQRQNEDAEFDRYVTLKLYVMSEADQAKALSQKIKVSLEHERVSEIAWWTNGSHGAQTRKIFLPQDGKKLRPEFYPTIPNPDQFIKDYLAAPESVLLLSGPAGTGKTTFLRSMILSHNLQAHVVYDEDLMKNDQVFQSFLFDKEADIMIFEDADTILTSREHDGNKLMSRFLNVADGLIKLPNKKLVFTTNILDMNKIDDALRRPGRCFAVTETRMLSYTEAKAAANAAGLPIPMEDRQYTVAELFNQGKRSYVRTFGFGHG